MLLVDVVFNNFKRYLEGNTSFYWTETATAFILIKPLPDYVVRTVIMKGKPEEVEGFRLRYLYTQVAQYVIGFTIDGKKMSEEFGFPAPTTSKIDYGEKPKVENKITKKE